MSSEFLFCIPSQREPAIWSQPGGDDASWSDADKYAAALMRAVAHREGYSTQDAQTLAIMAINKRLMHNIQYSELWERRLRSIGFI